MHDRADPMLGDQPRDQRLVGDVALGEGRARRAPPSGSRWRDCRSPPPASRRRARPARRGCRYSRRRRSPAPAAARVHPSSLLTESDAAKCAEQSLHALYESRRARRGGAGMKTAFLRSCAAPRSRRSARRLRDRTAAAAGVGGVEVTRFHLGQPIARGPDRDRAVRPGRRQPASNSRLCRRGRARADPARLDGGAATTAAPSRSRVIDLEQGSARGRVGGSLSIGVGGGSYGRRSGVGVGVGGTVPVGGAGQIVAHPARGRASAPLRRHRRLGRPGRRSRPAPAAPQAGPHGRRRTARRGPVSGLPRRVGPHYQGPR